MSLMGYECAVVIDALFATEVCLVQDLLSICDRSSLSTKLWIILKCLFLKCLTSNILNDEYVGFYVDPREGAMPKPQSKFQNKIITKKH